MAAIRAAKGFNALLEHFERFGRGTGRQIGNWWRLTGNRVRIFPAATSNRRTPSPEAAPRSGSRAYAGEPCLQKPRGILCTDGPRNIIVGNGVRDQHRR